MKPTRTTPKTAKTSSLRSTKATATRAATKKPLAGAPVKTGKTSGTRSSLTEVMRELEAAGSAQTRKTYLRHGAKEPMFGVSFATLKVLVKRIGVDHDLARALWDTGNYDARILALKIADPARVEPKELERWAREIHSRSCGAYVAMLAAESPHGAALAREWLASDNDALRAAGWSLSSCLANLDETTPDSYFLDRLAHIERSIHSAPNSERAVMNMAVITIGGRNATLRKAALAAAKRIGMVEVDHGDTACKTPDAVTYIEKMWAHASAKKFESPAAQERAREPMRTRC